MPKSRKQYQKKLATRNNAVMFNFYVSLLYNLYTSCYTWEGLPDSVDVRVLERGLISNGSVLFFYEPVLEEVICLPANPASSLNQYGIPYLWSAFGQDGYRREVLNKDSVYCFNLNNRYSDLQAVCMYAERLTNAQRSLDVNVSMQKYPGVVRTSPELQLTVENMLQSLFPA